MVRPQFSRAGREGLSEQGLGLRQLAPLTQHVRQVVGHRQRFAMTRPVDANFQLVRFAEEFFGLVVTRLPLEQLGQIVHGNEDIGVIRRQDAAAIFEILA